jgi:hypothetical protein
VTTPPARTHYRQAATEWHEMMTDLMDAKFTREEAFELVCLQWDAFHQMSYSAAFSSGASGEVIADGAEAVRKLMTLLDGQYPSDEDVARAVLDATVFRR